MGDLNAKVGNGRVGNAVETFGLGIKNDKGEIFVVLPREPSSHCKHVVQAESTTSLDMGDAR